jgi:hypothetical protein
VGLSCGGQWPARLGTHPARDRAALAAGRRVLAARAPHERRALEVPGVQRGHPCLFGADTLVIGEPAILTEGEFDALLLWQEAGDLLGMATLGSCNRGLSARALRYLLGCPRLLVAYDADAEGERGAERCSNSRRACSGFSRPSARM